MFGRLVESVTNALDLNVATLSGCIDIIVVPQVDGTLRSTPFHVRFGKTKLLRSREKEVSILVNDQPTDLKMKLGGAGEAYFDEIAEDEGEQIFDAPRTSSQPDLTKCEDDVRTTDTTPSKQDEENNALKVDASNPGRFPEQVAVQEAVRSKRHKASHTSPAIPRIMSPEEYYDGESSPIEFSLCGHLITGGSGDEMRDNDCFEANLLTWEKLNNDPMFWYHPALVCRFDNQPPYYPGKVALPLVASWVAFNRPLSLPSVRTLLETKVAATPIQDKSLIQWMLGSNDEHIQQDELPSALVPEQHICASCCKHHKTRRVLRPSSDQLASLNLKLGCNSITFTVTSSLQGTQTVNGSIYLWSRNSKILISDVDGTITKSDVLGQLFPVIGRDWSHEGVATLFSKCKKNNYKIIYLTARAIGQADPTRDYLFGLRQEQAAQLPDGPLIMSPDRLFSSFKREVIDRKPYVFKIAALKDVRSLFPRDYNPFYAGFGNRDTDHRSYVHIGVPESRVFIIDTSGHIHHVNDTYAKTYQSMGEIVEEMFPPVPDDEMGFHISLAEEEQEGGQQVKQNFGMFSCCQVSTVAPIETEQLVEVGRSGVEVHMSNGTGDNEYPDRLSPNGHRTPLLLTPEHGNSIGDIMNENGWIGYALLNVRANRYQETYFNMP